MNEKSWFLFVIDFDCRIISAFHITKRICRQNIVHHIFYLLVSRSSSTPTFGLYSSPSTTRPRMSLSAENTPVSNQTTTVRKSLYSNAGKNKYLFWPCCQLFYCNPKLIQTVYSNFSSTCYQEKAFRDTLVCRFNYEIGHSHGSKTHCFLQH